MFLMARNVAVKVVYCAKIQMIWKVNSSLARSIPINGSFLRADIEKNAYVRDV